MASGDLLQLEKQETSSSNLESTLLLCGRDRCVSKNAPLHREKPLSCAMPESKVLGRVKGFLGVLAEANKKLEQDAKDNGRSFDIENLTGDEPHVIEMDLMLGIADLKTPEALALAESALSGSNVTDHPDNSDNTDLDGSSDDDESEDLGDEKSPDSSCRASKKQKKIVELT